MAYFREEFGLTPKEVADFFEVTPQAIYLKMRNEKIGRKQAGKGYVIPSKAVRNLFAEKNIHYKKQIFSFQCCKGGVGKTSLAYSFAVRANMYGAKVLAIDLDMQGHLTLAFTNASNYSALISENVPVWNDLLKGDVSTIEEIIVPITETFHLVPSSLENSTVESIFFTNRKINLARSVSFYLDSIKDKYDFIILDCAPGFSGINTAATCASDTIIIPAAPDKFGADGISKTITELKEIQAAYSLNLNLKIIPNRHDARKRLSAVNLKKWQSEYQEYMLNCYIRENSEIPNSIDAESNVFDMPKRNAAAKEDLDIFTRELIGLTS